jgi:polyhydroxybutyrate depolymerase
VPDASTPTKWIVAGLVLGGVVVISLIVLMASLRDNGGTDSVGPVSTATALPPTTEPADDPRSATTEPGDIVIESLALQVGGIERSSTVISPADVAAGDRLPVVVALHGLGVNADAMSRSADWRGAVARDRFIAVFPQGVNDSWNMGPCCPPANLFGIDDVAFLDTLVGHFTEGDDANASRMYLSGFSNGALMVYTYACARPEVFAAVAPMAGTNVTGCRPSRPVSLLHQHGDADLVVPYGGGVALGSLVSSAPFPPVEDSVAAWASADGCSADPVVRTDAEVVRTEWSGCADSTRVELVKVPGKGHEWLTKGSYDPLEELLGFFGLS